MSEEWEKEMKTTTDRTVEKVEWPNGAKCAVAITFDYDSQVVHRYRLKGTKIQWTFGEFGPRVGLWRILNLLDEYDIKSTFFVPGMTVELYPDSVREIAKRGHEIACHGYSHTPVDKLSREEERNELEKTISILQKLSGVRPRGWAKPGGGLSPNTLDLLLDMGFIYIRNAMADDVPYRWRIDKGRDIIALPIEYSMDDAVFIAVSPPFGGLPSPDDVYDVWHSEFDGVYRLGRYFCLGCHPQVSGRAKNFLLLEKLIRYMKSHPHVWFTRCVDIAEYWKKKY